jgi:citrate synthase
VILKKSMDKVLAKLNVKDPLVEIAKGLEEQALKGSVFRRSQAVPERRFLQRHHHARDWASREHVHRHVSRSAACRGGFAHWKEQRDDPSTRIVPPAADLYGADKAGFCAHGEAIAASGTLL